MTEITVGVYLNDPLCCVGAGSHKKYDISVFPSIYILWNVRALLKDSMPYSNYTPAMDGHVSHLLAS